MTDLQKVLSLGAKPKLELKKPINPDAAALAGSVRQSFSHGRSKTVAVEVKRKRVGEGASSSRKRNRRKCRRDQSSIAAKSKRKTSANQQTIRTKITDECVCVAIISRSSVDERRTRNPYACSSLVRFESDATPNASYENEEVETTDFAPEPPPAPEPEPLPPMSAKSSLHAHVKSSKS